MAYSLSSKSSRETLLDKLDQLIALGLQVDLSREERLTLLEASTLLTLFAIGEDPDRDGLLETPARVARAQLDQLYRGYKLTTDQVMKVFHSESTGLVLVKQIPVYSTCEHHLLPFIGKAHVGYIPANGQVIGISKLARIVDLYARRLQIQERLTDQVADALETHLAPEGVIVVMEAEHMCMTIRGVQTPGTLTVTSSLRGSLLHEPEARAEALSLIHGGTL